MDPIDNLARAFDVAHGVIAKVRPDQWSSQSPCTEWDARAVGNHLMGGALMVSSGVAGKEMDMSTLGGDLLGDNPAATYRKAADDAIAAFRADPSVLGRPVKMPFGEMPGAMVAGLFTADHFTHAWDLAKATAQDTNLDPELAAGVLAATRQMISADMRRPGRFGPEVPAGAGASAADQVAAFLGRQP